jgi:parvulin-like peptidyl-prolyl isomerase
MRGRKGTVWGMTGTLVLLCAARGAPAQQTDANAAATVNGEVITKAELDSYIKKAGPPAVPLTEVQRKQQQKMALNDLIEAALMRQFLEKNAPPIDEKMVSSRMDDLVVKLRRDGKSIGDFCRELGKTETQLRADVAATIRWYAYAEKVATEEQLQKCYRDNKDLFDQVRVRVSEIFIHVATQAAPTEREAARNRLRELRDKIVANQIKFEDAAKEFSQSPSKEQGGDLDWIPHLRMGLLPILPDSVIEAAFAMQPGQVSDVMDSEFGLYIIKVTQRDNGHPSEYATVKLQVRDLYVEEMKISILSQMHKTADLKLHLQ